MADSISVWLSDGSGLPWTDLHGLDVTHPGYTGQPVAWQGCAEAAVPIGEATLEVRTDDAFVPEAEWCVSLLDPTLDAARIDGSTPVLVQGLVEGKWLTRLRGTMAWQPASVGNNLYAQGRGIQTTLGAIDTGEAGGDIIVTYQQASGERIQRAALAALAGQGIPDLVRAVLRYARESGLVVEAVDCAAIGREAAIVNERERVQAALQAAGLQPADLTTAAAWQRALDALSDLLVADHVAAVPGTAVTMQVLDKMGQECGRGRIRLMGA